MLRIFLIVFVGVRRVTCYGWHHSLRRDSRNRGDDLSAVIRATSNETRITVNVSSVELIHDCMLFSTCITFSI